MRDEFFSDDSAFSEIGEVSHVIGCKQRPRNAVNDQISLEPE
jgi:hypothetical protein